MGRRRGWQGDFKMNQVRSPVGGELLRPLRRTGRTATATASRSSAAELRVALRTANSRPSPFAANLGVDL